MSGSGVPEAARAAAISAAERQVRYVRAIRWTDVAGNWDVEFAADRCMALADAEVAAAVAEERATTGRRIEAAESVEPISWLRAPAGYAHADYSEAKAYARGYNTAIHSVRAALASPGESE